MLSEFETSLIISRAAKPPAAIDIHTRHLLASDNLDQLCFSGRESGARLCIVARHEILFRPPIVAST
jgi:hypothetical protein